MQNKTDKFKNTAAPQRAEQPDRPLFSDGLFRFDCQLTDSDTALAGYRHSRLQGNDGA